MANCEKEKPVYPLGEDLDTYQDFIEDFTADFTADFTVYDHSLVPAYDGTNCQHFWKGEGNSDCIGSFKVEITLKCNMASGEFCSLDGSFITDDGSELFFGITEGKILPYCGEGLDNYYYQSCFNDLAEITGGTGRFVYVTGSFYPNALIHNGNDNEPWFAKFSCEGKIMNFYGSDEDHHEDHLFPDL